MRPAYVLLKEWMISLARHHHAGWHVQLDASVDVSSSCIPLIAFIRGIRFHYLPGYCSYVLTTCIPFEKKEGEKQNTRTQAQARVFWGSCEASGCARSITWHLLPLTCFDFCFACCTSPSGASVSPNTYQTFDQGILALQIQVRLVRRRHFVFAGVGSHWPTGCSWHSKGHKTMRKETFQGYALETMRNKDW